ncbi:MAG: energy transducer TonB [Polyangiaceae bacterium]|nr:energy transducer TonB [Polyangiaceae bacterium]
MNGCGKIWLVGLALAGFFDAASLWAQDDGPRGQGAAAPQPAGAITLPKALDAQAFYPDSGHGDATVILELLVTADGRVGQASLVQGPEPFASAALAQASSWRFEPARRAGTAIAAKISFRVRFVETRSSEPGPEPDAQAAAAGTPGRAPVRPEPPLEVTVRGDRPPPSASRMTRAEVEQLPGALGDPFRAVEAMPGVIPAISGLPYFYVRGAPPGNVGYLVDGIRVPLLFHAFLGPSVLHPATLDDVVLYRGAYPSKYGRYAGAVIAADTYTPPDRLTGEASVRLYDAGGLVSTPLAGQQGKVSVAGRYSYTGLLVSQLSSVTLGYWDYQALASYDLGPKDTLSLFTFGAYDFIGSSTMETDEPQDVQDLNEDAGTATEFHRVSLRYDHRTAQKGRLRLSATLGEDRLIGTLGSVRERLVGTRAELDHPLSADVAVHTGADFELHRYKLALDTQILNYYEFLQLFPSRDDIDVGGWLETEIRPDSWVTVTPGLRVDLFRSMDKQAVGVDPRVTARFAVTRRLRIEHALGMAHQPPGFLPGLPTAQLARIRGGLQRSIQASSGVAVDLPDDLTASVSVFDQIMLNLSDPLGISRQYSTDPELVNRRAIGSSYGLELQLQRPLTKRLGGFLAYTLSRSTRSYRTISSLAAFDRTHVLQGALALDLGRHWRVGGRAVLLSGVPTQTTSPQGPRFGGDRAAPFFRIDVRGEKRWPLGEHAWVAATAELLNATFAHEVVGRTCITTCRESRVGPVTIPSIGVEAAF